MGGIGQRGRIQRPGVGGPGGGSGPGGLYLPGDFSSIPAQTVDADGNVTLIGGGDGGGGGGGGVVGTETLIPLGTGTGPFEFTHEEPGAPYAALIYAIAFDHTGLLASYPLDSFNCFYGGVTFGGTSVGSFISTSAINVLAEIRWATIVPSGPQTVTIELTADEGPVYLHVVTIGDSGTPLSLGDIDGGTYTSPGDQNLSKTLTVTDDGFLVGGYFRRRGDQLPTARSHPDNIIRSISDWDRNAGANPTDFVTAEFLYADSQVAGNVPVEFDFENPTGLTSTTAVDRQRAINIT